MVHDVNPSDLLDTMAEGLYLVDRKRVISYWNASAERITGYSAQQALGRFCGDGLLNHVDEHGEGLCGSRCPLLRTMSDGVDRDIRCYAHHAEGHLVPVHVTARALRDETGTITGAVETFTDDSHATEAEGRLRIAEKLAITDHLTGLGNRRLLERILTEGLNGAEGADTAEIAVLALDIDRFKTVNDNHGHAFGDEVIKTIAHTLTAVVADDGEVGRLGGDEFLVVMRKSSSREVDELADRVRAAVAQTSVVDAGIALRITVSIGVAVSIAGDTPETLVKRADDSMLEAKRLGRNTVVVSSSGEGRRGRFAEFAAASEE